MGRPTLLPNRLSLENLHGDLFGGLTAGVVALPLALAFGVASGMENGAAAGLYGAILVGFLASLFGGTPSQVSGPTGPMTVVVAGLLAAQAGHSITPGLLAFTVLMAGVLQVLFGFAGLGSLIRFVPTPVISGFMSGVGVIIVLLQLGPLMGLPSPASPLEAVRTLPEQFSRANLQALGLGLGTVALIYLSPRVLRRLPATLVALLAGTSAALALGLEIPTIGQIPRGLPSPVLALPELGALPMLIESALTLAVLGTIDSLLTSVVADQVTGTRHSSNQELVGQGIGNAVSGLFGGLPGAGATMRTVINFRSGGRTPLAGMIHSLVLLAVLLALAPLASRIPLAVLAAILITVGVGIIDYRGLRHLPHLHGSDGLIMVLVLGLTVFVDLIQAVGVGVVLASVFFVKRLGDLSLGRYVPLEEVDSAWADEAGLPEEFRRRVYVLHSEGPYFFGSAQDLLALADSAGEDRVEAVIVRMKRVPFIDQSGAYALEDMIRSMQARGIPVLITGLHPEPKDLLERLGILGRVLPAERAFPRFAEAVAWLQENLAALKAGA